MPSKETWETFRDYAESRIGGIVTAIDAINEKQDRTKEESSVLLVEITRLGENLGGKMDAIDKRMDVLEKQNISINHTVNGNAKPGLKARQAVTEVRLNWITGFLSIAFMAGLTYIGLK